MKGRAGTARPSGTAQVWEPATYSVQRASGQQDTPPAQYASDALAAAAYMATARRIEAVAAAVRQPSGLLHIAEDCRRRALVMGGAQ